MNLREDPAFLALLKATGTTYDEVEAEVVRVAEMVRGAERGECEREFVPWLDDELHPRDDA